MDVYPLWLLGSRLPLKGEEKAEAMTVFTPSSPEDVLSAVQWALAEEAPLEIIGHGSKRGIGRPLQTEHVLDLYGPDVRKPGTFARSCLLARRMVERGVRLVQLFHRGWDQHFNLPADLTNQCRDVDQPTAALIKDLRQRGLLDDTLVIFATEFGRTVFSQGRLGDPGMGRDHHGRCFTMWAAGAGIKPGITYGETDDYCYNIVKDGVHIHDWNATILHLLGIDHEQLTYRFQGRDFRLTDVEGTLVKGLLS